jgi:hypothetical protein
MAAFAYPHLIDDFLFGVPDEFGLTNQQTQVMVGVFTIILFSLIVGAAREARWAYAGTAFVGGFLSLAILLKHIPKMLLPEPYWSGAFSEALNWGVLVTGFILLVTSLLAIRQKRKEN